MCKCGIGALGLQEQIINNKLLLTTGTEPCVLVLKMTEQSKNQYLAYIKHIKHQQI